MFAFSQVDPNRTGSLSRWDIPVNQWWDIKHQAGVDYQAGTAVSRFTEDQIANGVEISAALANKQFGIPGHLEFDGPIDNQVAALRNARKKRELELQAYLEAADHKWYSPKGISGFGAMMLGNLSHPLDFGLIFLPIVGSAAKAKTAATAGRGLFRQRLARGLVTEEALAAAKYPKITGALIEGTVGQAIAEIPVFVQAQRDQADYGLEDAALNIAAGGVFAGALHTLFRGIERAFDSLEARTKDLLLHREADAFVKGETPDAGPTIRLDENVIEQEVDAQLRREAEQAVESEMEIQARLAARQAREPERPFDVIDAIEGHVGGKLSLEYARGLREDITPTGAARTLFVAKGGYKLDDVLSALHREGLFQRIESDEQLLEAILRAAEARKGYRAQTAGETKGANAIRKQRIAAERERRIREFIESRKPERLQAAKMAELARQQKEGKILSQEQVEAFRLAPDEKAVAVMEEDGKIIETNLKADNDARLANETLTPEQKERLQRQLEDELDEVDDNLELPNNKAIDQARHCLTQNG